MRTYNVDEYHYKHMLNPVKKIVFGILVVKAGALLLLFNMGLLPMELKPIIFSWQMLLIALGFLNLFNHHSWVPGVLLMCIGGFFLAPMIHPFPFNFVGLLWPSLIIIAGLLMIVHRSFHFHHHHKHFKGHCEFKNESGFIEEINIFGGSKQKVANQEFKGGRIVNVFGGAKIDLTQATLTEGKSVIEIVCVFGGLQLIVPSDWTVQLEVVSIMGGFTDHRNLINVPTEGSKVLLIKGVTMFGGGEIKSF